MDAEQVTIWSRSKRHLRNRLISGLLVMVPLGVTILVLRVLFATVAGFLAPFLRLIFKQAPDPAIELISIGLFIVLIYVVGVVTALMFGRRLFSLGEALVLKIPVVKSIYGAAKQVVDTFSHAKTGSFREVVMLDFPCAGTKSIGFVTSVLHDRNGVEQLVVLVPTAPSPTTGFMVIVPSTAVQRLRITVEEGFKMVVSGGMLLPDGLTPDTRLPVQSAPPREGQG